MQFTNVSIAGLPTNNKAIPLPDDVTFIQRTPTQNWHRITLGAIVLLATFLNFFQLQQNGYGNPYYAAGVKSMLHSWSNFYFVSLDPGGFVTVDKPPVAFWLQALCAKILGFSSWSLFLPQALAGIAATLIIYCIIRRKFGPGAGLIAALVLATTPIVVVMNRDNNVDMVLACVSLLAAWSISIAVDTGKLRWLLLGGALVGLGFNVKMLEAYLVVPAFGLFYLLASPHRWPARLLHLGAALLVLIVVSFSWAISVDLIPPWERPYVGSSQTNSEIELALGYNGLGRVTIFKDLFPAPKEPQKHNEERTTHADNTQLSTVLAAPGLDLATPTPNKDTKKDVSIQAPSETGTPGPFRLFNQNISGQISWLLPLALMSILVLVWQRRLLWPLDYNWHAILLWGTWLLTMFIYFSENAGFHIYYMVMLAPAIAALTGIGLVTLWRNYQQRSRNWRGWTLPAVFFVSVAVQVYFLSFYTSWDWLLLLVASAGLLATILLCLLQVQRITHQLQTAPNTLASGPEATTARPRSLIRRWQAIIYTMGIATLLLVPMIWSTYTLSYPSNGGFPLAGPASINNKPSRPATGDGFSVSQHALAYYLQLNRGNDQFLMATLSTSTADPFILLTDEPIMALGGYSGSNPILTVDKLQNDVEGGVVRFFYFSPAPQVSENTSNGDRTISLSRLGNVGANTNLVRWVAQSCQVVPTDEWQPQYVFVKTVNTSATYTKAKKKIIQLTSANKPALFDCGNL
jgi:4-amino-4-deoxy-L-arabinose transferase-like glycosyltransferase